MKAAARMGLFMGLFWALKYILVIVGGKNQVLSMLYIALTVVVPFIAYRCTLLYRNLLGGDKFSFFHAWQFGLLLYAFSALIVAPLHFYYYKNVVTPQELSDIVNQAISVLSEMKTDPKVLEQAKSMGVPTPIQMTLQGIANNITIGAVVSIPIAFLTKRQVKQNNN